MDELFSLFTEYELKKHTNNELTYKYSNNNIVKINGKKKSIVIGKGLGLKVNTQLGMSDLANEIIELRKIEEIGKLDFGPDSMMDLSVVKGSRPLYKSIIDRIGIPVGTIPYYLCFDSDKGLDKARLIEEIIEQAENGVGFMTLHFTANKELLKLASLTRRTPVISRGGSVILRDLIRNNRNQNILFELYDEIVKIANKYDIVISVGTTFRPSHVNQALDSVHLQELKQQEVVIKKLIASGVRVMQEGIGHSTLNAINSYSNKLKKGSMVPFMPLGPIPSERTVGMDHISAAIGASYMAQLECADLINTVTAEEHTGGIPSINSIIESIKTMNVVKTVINDSMFDHFLKEEVSTIRKNCMITSKDSLEIGCIRCGDLCPYKLINTSI